MRVAEGLARARTGSAGEMGEDCGSLWWSSIQRASMASEVSWIHWSIRAAISALKFAAWLRRVSSKLAEAREAPGDSPKAEEHAK